MGKSALLAYLSGRIAGWQVASAVGVESEMDLAYGGLHQLCAPLLDHLGELPAPQRDALATVFGLSTGPAPDRFLAGLPPLEIRGLNDGDARPLLLGNVHGPIDAAVTAQIITESHGGGEPRAPRMRPGVPG